MEFYLIPTIFFFNGKCRFRFKRARKLLEIYDLRNQQEFSKLSCYLIARNLNITLASCNQTKALTSNEQEWLYIVL